MSNSQKFIIYSMDGIILPDIGKFPGGEVRVRVPTKPYIEVTIKAYLLNSDDVMTLVMLTDALRRMGVVSIRLTMPYIPYARQDRVCNEGEAFSIKVFADIINSCRFSSVVVYDAHSVVSTKAIDRCINIPSENMIGAHVDVMNYINSEDSVYLLSPDAGAVEKTKAILASFPKLKGIVFAEKKRDLITGRIIKTVIPELPSDIGDSKLLIVDDICDGGRTFIELAKISRQYCNGMSLYVTHGIFSQGSEIFEPYFDNVWCSVDFRNLV